MLRHTATLPLCASSQPTSKPFDPRWFNRTAFRISEALWQISRRFQQPTWVERLAFNVEVRNVLSRPSDSLTLIVPALRTGTNSSNACEQSRSFAWVLIRYYNTRAVTATQLPPVTKKRGKPALFITTRGKVKLPPELRLCHAPLSPFPYPLNVSSSFEPVLTFYLTSNLPFLDKRRQLEL